MREISYQPHKALCADGITRMARVQSYWDGARWGMHADTYFSVPAFVKANGKTVRGYVSIATVAGYQTATDGDPHVLKFRAVLYRKNHAAIAKKG